MNFAQNSNQIHQILNNNLFWQDKEKSNKTLKRAFLSLLVLLLIYQIRVSVILVAIMWARAARNSPFVSIIFEYLFEESKTLWKTHSKSMVPSRFQPYLDLHSDFSEECDFLPSEEDISINLKQELRLNFISSGVQKRSPRFRDSNESRISCTGGHPMNK